VYVDRNQRTSAMPRYHHAQVYCYQSLFRFLVHISTLWRLFLGFFEWWRVSCRFTQHIQYCRVSVVRIWHDLSSLLWREGRLEWRASELLRYDDYSSLTTVIKHYALSGRQTQYRLNLIRVCFGRKRRDETDKPG